MVLDPVSEEEVAYWIEQTFLYIMDKQFYFLGVYFSWYDVIIAGGIFYMFGFMAYEIYLKIVEGR